ncbi:hypothetical protein GIB67_041660 [Kingdonia uniflora]|uniref:Uncharacterized protein n=1 Tax=Kingdonia uniflora TaxID=39325 RepID=A0A7J7MQJ0_9MAGN|nr:hypothetical protein GIB67_041660 [Kingdonia uniflora]
MAEGSNAIDPAQVLAPHVGGPSINPRPLNTRTRLDQLEEKMQALGEIIDQVTTLEERLDSFSDDQAHMGERLITLEGVVEGIMATLLDQVTELSSKITTDSNKVLVFGSFTEDDLISLKKKSPENIIDPLEKILGLQFGSLDFASVKSLGNPDIKLKHSKLSELSKSAAPPKFVNEDNGFSSSKTIEDTGYTHSPPHVFPLNNDVRGPEKTSVDLASLYISETNTGALKQSPSLKPDTLDDATLEHQSNLVISVPNEVHVDSSEPLASKEDNQNALNGPRAAATDLLPGDVTNSISSKPRQEDTQEFLSFVMDQKHDELLQLEGHFSNSNGGSSSVVSSLEDDGWETVGPKNKTAITRAQSFVPSELSAIFDGQLRSTMKARGSKASATIQPQFSRSFCSTLIFFHMLFILLRMHSAYFLHRKHLTDIDNPQLQRWEL